MRLDTFAEFMSNYHKDGFLHESGEMHKQLIYHLANGDNAYFSESNIDFLKFNTGKLSDDPLRQAQNLMIAVCSVCSHIAILCNVNSEFSLSLADYYIQLTQNMRTRESISPYFRNVFLHYCDIIKKYQQVPYTHTIHRITNYIYDHIYAPVTVNSIAETLDMHPSYISQIFRNETGVKLKRFIHLEKIKEAKNLMTYTGMSFTEIAAHLGYSDLSHFTRSCKTYIRITPSELKSQNGIPQLSNVGSPCNVAVTPEG